MTLIQDGLLNLTDQISSHLKHLSNADHITGEASLIMPLPSGLAAWRPYGEGLIRRRGQDIAGTQEAKDIIIQEIAAEGPEYPSGTTCIYSDLGFILLGMLIEKLTGCTLEQAFYRRIKTPVGLKRMFFTHIVHGQPEDIPVPVQDIAATEVLPHQEKIPARRGT